LKRDLEADLTERSRHEFGVVNRIGERTTILVLRVADDERHASFGAHVWSQTNKQQKRKQEPA
jgi:hypothetical protein